MSDFCWAAAFHALCCSIDLRLVVCVVQTQGLAAIAKHALKTKQPIEVKVIKTNPGGALVKGPNIQGKSILIVSLSSGTICKVSALQVLKAVLLHSENSWHPCQQSPSWLSDSFYLLSTAMICQMAFLLLFTAVILHLCLMWVWRLTCALTAFPPGYIPLKLLGPATRRKVLSRELNIRRAEGE